MTGQRRDVLDSLYELLAEAARRQGGPRLLRDATAGDGWPSHGVYVFFEPGECREDGVTPRVVRVGTHALTATSGTNLWGRLRTHRGSLQGRSPGGGNHRGSVFRLHVGTALVNRDGCPEAAPTWGHGSSAPRDVRDREAALEQAVSRHLGTMHVIALPVPEREHRAELERGCIALLSNHDRDPIDPPSADWLGNHADRDAVRRSGLWNVNHVTEPWTPSTVDRVASALQR